MTNKQELLNTISTLTNTLAVLVNSNFKTEAIFVAGKILELIKQLK